MGEEMNLSDRPMTPAAYSGMLSATKIELLAMAENLFNRRFLEMENEIAELRKMVAKMIQYFERQAGQSMSEGYRRIR
jgi:HAMP domain-containing protein